jgi:hypothetical protein
MCGFVEGLLVLTSSVGCLHYYHAFLWQIGFWQLSRVIRCGLDVI